MALIRKRGARWQAQAFKQTSDDWYPSYKMEGGSALLVKVFFTQTGPNPPINGEWRVCAWGGDDFGMERDFTDYTAAWHCFLEVISLNNVTRELLIKRGFIIT